MTVKAFLSTCLVFGLGLAAVLPANHLYYDRRGASNGTAPSPGCTNGPTSRKCWDGDFSIDTDAEVKWPNTGRTVYYHLEITNQTMYPDGEPRNMLVINGKYPGPVLTANWGDFFEIEVTNKMEHNGTSMHWHGISQVNSCNQDGVNGVTECPIPPGATRKYRFQATEFGTTWYHSHFTYQYGDGILGTMVINGPTTADYDIDLGTLPITDYYYQSTWTMGHAADGSRPYNNKAGPPTGDNILINGTNVNLSPDGDGGYYHNNTLIPGKKYLLRLINTAVDNAYMISLDSHKFTVIQADFVPIQPYETDWLFIGIGQRYDVVFTADQDIDNYWFRAKVPSGCGDNNNNKGEVAVFNYQGCDVEKPESEPSSPVTPRCYDETSLKPYIPKPVSRSDFEHTYSPKDTLTVNLTRDAHKVFFWTINDRSINVDWENPTLKYIADNNSSFKSASELNIYELPDANIWAFWVIQNAFPVAHPIHLHGHDFYLLGASSLSASSSAKTPLMFSKDNINELNFDNPTRRDVAMLPSNGWMVIAFRTDNPGAWLMHCHIAWHVSEGLAVQFLERESDIEKTLGLGGLGDSCQEWRKWYDGGERAKDDSGL